MKLFILNLLLLFPLCLYADDDDMLNSSVIELEGKNFYSLFDSFGAGLQWQGYLSTLSGMNFSRQVNQKTNAGGTKTGVYGTSCGMQRAIKLYEMTQGERVDYIFVENVNDVSEIKNSGNIEDAPFFSTQSKTFLTDRMLYKKEDAIQYWNDNFQTVVSGIDPKLGQVMLINYCDTLKSGFTIKIKSSPQKKGTIYCKFGSSGGGFEVDVNMSKQDIADKILECCYCAGWTVSQSDYAEVAFSYYKQTDTEISLDVKDTGIDYEVTRSNAFIPVPFCFVGNDISEWENINCWTTTPSYYSIWKGFISYLKTSFPDTKIYVVIPTYYSFKFSDIDNDEFDYSKINNSVRLNALKLFELQRNVANYYNLPIIDLEKESGINIYNAKDYYNDNNVHINNNGYQVWAETIYRLMLEEESAQSIALYDHGTEANDNESIIIDNSEHTKNVSLLGRTLYKDGDWNTLCLPFAVSDFAGTPLEGATVKELLNTSDLSNDGILTLNFSSNLSAIEAGKPYIVKWESGSDIEDPSFSNVTISNTGPIAVTFGGKCQFVGTYSPFVINGANIDEILMMSGNNRLGYSNTERTIGAFRAHFVIPLNVANSRAITGYVLNFEDGMTTGICNISALEENKDAIFTLDGRRLNEMPSIKGVYIVKGKKVVVK